MIQFPNPTVKQTQPSLSQGSFSKRKSVSQTWIYPHYYLLTQLLLLHLHRTALFPEALSLLMTCPCTFLATGEASYMAIVAAFTLLLTMFSRLTTQPFCSYSVLYEQLECITQKTSWLQITICKHPFRDKYSLWASYCISVCCGTASGSSDTPAPPDRTEPLADPASSLFPS